MRPAALDADVVCLVPFLDHLDAITDKPIAQCQNGLSTSEADSEVHPARLSDGLPARP